MGMVNQIDLSERNRGLAYIPLPASIATLQCEGRPFSVSFRVRKTRRPLQPTFDMRKTFNPIR